MRREPGRQAPSDGGDAPSTLAYMATMPAWQDHPRVTAGRS